MPVHLAKLRGRLWDGMRRDEKRALSAPNKEPPGRKKKRLTEALCRRAVTTPQVRGFCNRPQRPTGSARRPKPAPSQQRQGTRAEIAFTCFLGGILSLGATELAGRRPRAGQGRRMVRPFVRRSRPRKDRSSPSSGRIGYKA